MKRKNFTLLQIVSICAVIFLCANMGYSQWYTNGSSIVYTSDKVGIGTSNPAVKLHVEGNIRTNGTINLNNSSLTSGSGMNGGIFYIKLDGTGGLKTTANFEYDNGITLNALGAYPDITFNSQGTTRMIIKGGSGNVGIGCSDPSVKLAVEGKIQATEIEIKSSPCSDYVFEKDYKLMSLSDVEKFVTGNKHLPEVPSAKDFKENGYRVGEMDDLLLRKIEELTLYVIEQNKKIEIQNKRIEALESENTRLKTKKRK